MDEKREMFATVDHNVRIQLTGATKTTKIESDDPAFPQYYFDFKPLRSIGNTITQEKSVIGNKTYNKPLNMTYCTISQTSHINGTDMIII